MTADRIAGYVALVRLESLSAEWEEQARRTRAKASLEACEGRHRSAEICRAAAVLLEQCAREVRAVEGEPSAPSAVLGRDPCDTLPARVTPPTTRTGCAP